MVKAKYNAIAVQVVRLSALTPADFTSKKYSWYSFLLEAESTQVS